MIKFEKLNLSSCKTNKEVKDKIQERIKSVSLEEITEELQKDFVFQEKTIKTIYTALATGQNALLYGPGGFSKTVLIKAFCELLGIPIITKIGHEESSVEELLGIPNMKKLLEESTFETAFENSIFSNRGVCVLEEFTDCRPSVAAALKDVLTEKGFREKDSFKESLISSVIITGNTNPADLAISDSLKAFYNERFPHQENVIWQDFSEASYSKFLRVYFKDNYQKYFKEFILLAKICSNTDTLVSPRIAAAAGDVIIDLGVKYLDTISAINTKDLMSYQIEVDNKYKEENELLFLSKVTKKISLFENSINTSKSVTEYFQTYILLGELEKTLPTEVSEKMTEKLIAIKVNIKELQEKIISISPSTFQFEGLVRKIRTNDI